MRVFACLSCSIFVPGKPVCNYMFSMDLSLWIFLLCKLCLCSCSCKGHCNWVWGLGFDTLHCFILLLPPSSMFYLYLVWSGQSRERKECPELRGKGEAEGRNQTAGDASTAHLPSPVRVRRGCSWGWDAVLGRAAPLEAPVAVSRSSCVQGNQTFCSDLTSSCDYCSWGSGAGEALVRAAPGALAEPQLREEGAEWAQKQMQSVWMRLLWCLLTLRSYSAWLRRGEGLCCCPLLLSAHPSKSTRVFPWVGVGGWHVPRDHLSSSRFPGTSAASGALGPGFAQRGLKGLKGMLGCELELLKGKLKGPHMEIWWSQCDM